MCVRQALLELQSNADIKPVLREVFFTGARVGPAISSPLTVCVCLCSCITYTHTYLPPPSPFHYPTCPQEVDAAGKKAIVVSVPVPQQRLFQKVQQRLVRELEKKFSGRPVVFVAQRRILPKPKRNQRTCQKQLRPRRLAGVGWMGCMCGYRLALGQSSQ